MHLGPLTPAGSRPDLAALGLALAALATTALAHQVGRRAGETNAKPRELAAEQTGYAAGVMTSSQNTFDAGFIAGAHCGHELGTAGQPLPESVLAVFRRAS